MNPTRREVIAASLLWAQAVEAAQQHAHGAASGPAAAYRFVFLKPPEVTRLRELAAVIVPADARSGGAAAARVEEYIDFVLSRAERPLQQLWQRGLARVKPEQLPALAKNEFAPKTADEEFFVQVRGAVTEAFYTPEEGITKELGYQGLGFLREFPGCTHESHNTPAGYQPRLRTRGA